MISYRIPEMTRKYVEYDMIQSHTDLPAVPDFRVRLLHAFLGEHRILSKSSDLYAVVITLVQLGMDTHDLIDTDIGKRSMREMRSRQLKVLAGDYFSSRFYYLLAQAGQIEMVSKISAAVCEVNRLKVNLYTKMKQLKVSAEEYLSQTVQLKSELFQLFAGMLEGASSRVWSDLLPHISSCEVVLEELQRSESVSKFRNSWAFWHIMQEGTAEEKHQLSERDHEAAVIASLVQKYDIRAKLAAKLRTASEVIRQTAARMDSDQLGGELIAQLDSFMKKIAAPALAAEG
ncbi:heptaprenyl diphosphate synthase component 1 [Paenibacillus protaetiae]|uniref:Heptaprenyl diphosphate synthase n=1 Tax=Paenibacillus protaetiae TaxID=2509456 RepID=A0A4P6EU30_9BACL|nr:heptaprenyl diphosphate synthase component 1 [Paenibacillus protaetiae]QAY66166.1 heptaprenyl diphosphate synthase [Paenibacillus protaetiae]